MLNKIKGLFTRKKAGAAENAANTKKTENKGNVKPGTATRGAVFLNLIKKLSIYILLLAVLALATTYVLLKYKLITPEELVKITKLQDNPSAPLIIEKLDEHFKPVMEETKPEVKPEDKKDAKDEKKSENPATVKPADSGKDKIDVTEKNKKIIAELEKQEQERILEEKKRISKLARMYESMKPKEAADIINKIDDNTAVQILLKMEEETAAKVLANLPALKAATLSKVLIKYRAEKPKTITLPNTAATNNLTANEQNVVSN